MSDENQDAAQAVVPDQAAEESQNPEAAEDGQPPDDSKPGREAARYRHQLREAEAQRDELQTKLDGLRAEVFEHLVGARLDPRLARAAGFGPESIFDEAGRLDPSTVAAIVDKTRLEFRESLNPRKGDPALGRSHDYPMDPAAAFDVGALLKGA